MKIPKQCIYESDKPITILLKLFQNGISNYKHNAISNYKHVSINIYNFFLNLFFLTDVLGFQKRTFHLHDRDQLYGGSEVGRDHVKPKPIPWLLVF